MCKRKIKVKICIGGECHTLQVELHPRGCMRATRTHIDIPEAEAPPLFRDAASNRGVRFSWIRVGDCLVLYAPGLPDVKICGPIPEPRGPLLLRRLKRGVLYLGL